MGNNHHHSHQSTDIQEMKMAFWLNLSFTIIEFVGGFLTNSFAIIADAFHDLGDSIALGLGIWLEKFSKKEPSMRYTFGYKRFSLLSACVLSTILIIGAGAMSVKSVENFLNPKEVSSWGMMGLAVLGVIINGIAFWRMQKKSNNDRANSRAMTLHFMEDVLGWVAVLLGGAVMYFTQWYWIDSVLTFGISMFILWNAVPNLLSVFKIFLQIVPDKVDISALLEKLKSIENVKDIHRFYVWTEDGESHIATLHALILAEDLPKMEYIRQQMQEILDQHHIHNTTIQIEIQNCH